MKYPWVNMLWSYRLVFSLAEKVRGSCTPNKYLLPCVRNVNNILCFVFFFFFRGEQCKSSTAGGLTKTSFCNNIY